DAAYLPLPHRRGPRRAARELGQLLPRAPESGRPRRAPHLRARAARRRAGPEGRGPPHLDRAARRLAPRPPEAVTAEGLARRPLPRATAGCFREGAPAGPAPRVDLPPGD